MTSLTFSLPNDRHTKLDRQFAGWVAVLTLACLWPIWWYRTLPMQDYPLHLFIAYVLSTFSNPGFNWAQFYDVNPGFGVYSLDYGLVRFFTTLTDIETGGKLATSLYVLLMAAVVLRAARNYSDHHVPWGLLLIFPFIFNQTYFLGLNSYLISIPLLFLALIELNHFTVMRITAYSVARQSLILLFLFLAHPFTVLVYLVFGYCMALFHANDRKIFIRSVIPPLTVTAIFVAWYLASSTQSAISKLIPQLSWTHHEYLFSFYSLMFTGMRWFNGVDMPSLAVWTGILALLSFYAVKCREDLRPSAPVMACLVLAFAGYLVLPFAIKSSSNFYSYFNLRLAPITYILLAYIAANIKLPSRLGHLLGCFVISLVALSINMQGKVAAETGQIFPLFSKMQKNALVLPVLLNTGTEILDPNIFFQTHLWDHYYYHVLDGGGASPIAPMNSMLPVTLKHNRSWPLLDRSSMKLWPEVISNYRYILVRGDEPKTLQALGQMTTFLARSGSWTLFENLERE